MKKEESFVMSDLSPPLVERLMSGDMRVVDDVLTSSIACLTNGVEVNWSPSEGLAALQRDVAEQVMHDSTNECLVCPALVTSRDGMYKHFTRSHGTVWETLMNWIDQGEPDMPIRPNASNRQVYAQMRLWGWTEQKKANLEVVMRHPNGSTLKIHAPEAHTRNGPTLLIALYEMTGCTPEEFWDKPNEDEARFLPAEPTDPIDRNISTRLLDLLIGQSRPLTTQWMGEAMGYTDQQVMSAMTYMKARHLVRRVKRGMWQSVDHREVTEHQTVDIGVTTNQTETPEQPVETPVAPESPITVISTPLTVPTDTGAPVVQPVPMGREVTDDDVYGVLDLLVPDGFKARHYPAVSNWVEATKALVNALRQ